MQNLLKSLDYSVLQQCMHCGMCLPVCPTYAETKEERHGPRGRISLMRAIADGELEVTRAFGDEMYYCLGCLACTSACPAGVNYAELFETARAEVERRHVIKSTQRDFWRWSVVKVLFTRPRLLRLAGRGLWLWRVTGMQALTRALRLTYLLPRRLRELEPQAPRVGAKFSHQLIKPVETPSKKVARTFLSVPPSQTAVPFRRVAVLTGCVQDLAFPEINRATVDVLLANNCEVHTPPVQPCCGSLHAHNGDLESARTLARRLIDMIPPESFDAIISNAGGCGSHLRHYDHLLRDDPAYAARAVEWSRKLRDISEYLVEIDFRKPEARAVTQTVTYHESCHLCHGQKVSAQPRAVLRAIPGVELHECPEATWCCGSAGIYNITQPVTAGRLQDRKMANLRRAHAGIITTANPGCHLQIQNGLRAEKDTITEVAHPVVLLARAYAAERK
ncbi:(Fe-S)-binding protein [Ereboglobus luteus]|uniref:Glycolate oxidase iron-sulfur subunit n=1 Tax=Ereboglobus luteus TaxID=1796921 RepID=A0A2U8E1G4_9BACT|nr:heterodisulfide reductase-related iron-sulfur binding cluster [Ereboglobus luteus]AWI08718.1 hypothetical protein CKA38_05125 [Ereboglobus luteus]